MKIAILLTFALIASNVSAQEIRKHSETEYAITKEEVRSLPQVKQDIQAINSEISRLEEKKAELQKQFDDAKDVGVKEEVVVEEVVVVETPVEEASVRE